MPAANPSTPGKIALGERMFFDAGLSRDRSISCASCHHPELGFSDTGATSLGVGGRRGRRNAPTLLNRAYARALFWDGRVTTLEEQVLHPIQDTVEMGMPLRELVSRLIADARYRAAFQRVFGGEPTSERAAFALAAYIRSLRSGDAPVDRWHAGDTTALSPSAVAGLALFTGKANCATCHIGPNFTDEQFHNTGVAWQSGPPTDSGRYLVTRESRDIGAFKTPTLREITCTAPYMHDGSVRTLEDVIEFYDRGGHSNSYLDEEVRPLSLTSLERRNLRSLLESLGRRCRDPQAGEDGRHQ